MNTTSPGLTAHGRALVHNLELAHSLARAHNLACSLIRLHSIALELTHALTNALDITRTNHFDFARVLDRIRDRTCVLADANNRARDYARNFNLDHALLLDRARDRDRARAFARDRALTRDRIFALARDLDLDRACALDLDLARALDRARGCALDRARARPLACTRDLDRDLDRALDHALDRTQFLVHYLDRMNGKALAITEGIEALNASAQAVEKKSTSAFQPAERLVGLTTRLLPTGHRDRYTEEFKAELHNMAQAKATRTMQARYALRLLGRVWKLREALLTPDWPPFYRARRAACWVLASDWRTWGLLGPLLAFGVINVHLSQGWGSALFTLPGMVGFYAGVEWLRKRWDVEAKRRDKAAGDLSNE